MAEDYAAAAGKHAWDSEVLPSPGIPSKARTLTRLSQEQRDGLLSDLSQMGSSGRAESESTATFKRTFLPVVEHARALDPDVVLIVGDRGAGKSKLFRALVQEGLLDPILRRAPSARAHKLAADNVDWYAGHPLRKDFPDDAGLRAFVASQRQKPEALAEFWCAFLTRLLSAHFPQGHALELSHLLNLPAVEVHRIVGQFRQAQKSAMILLDQLDQTLEAPESLDFRELRRVGHPRWLRLGHHGEGDSGADRVLGWS